MPRTYNELTVGPLEQEDVIKVTTFLQENNLPYVGQIVTIFTENKP